MSGKVVTIAIVLLIAGVVLPIALGATGIGSLLRQTQDCATPSGTMLDGTTTAAGTTAVTTDRTLTGTNAGTYGQGTLCASNATPSTTAQAWLSPTPAGAFGGGYFGDYRNIMLIAFGLGIPLLFLVWILAKGGIRIGSA